ncbi:MAG: hypothetical protein KC505_00915 [Myxococcales bacterium]|nr:hypothetical protein [Myxococcales bacterium]USN50344.1 MAG: hypothetical protein H6731_08770 [Myxococcales bacterium]
MRDVNFYQQKYLQNLPKKLQQKRIRRLRSLIALGKEESLEQHEETFKKLSSALGQSYKFKIECVAKLAKKMVIEHYESHPHAILYTLKKLLKNIAEHTDVEISAHPRDAKIISSNIHDFKSSMARKFLISEDKNMEQGSLIIKANKSIIDARISTQIRRATHVILN